MAKVYKRAYIEAAKLAGDSSAMDEIAEKIKDRAVSYASEHTSNDRRGHTYAESFRTARVNATTQGYVQDRMIYSVDPQALSKEFGHMTKGKEPKWVPGQLSLIRAIGEHSG